jgi:UDP-N-acetylmuramoyl-tripeptide--D-alanyl-D-alanine ligase
MIRVSLQALTHVLNAELIGSDTQIASVTTDTRKIEAGGLFIALKGEKFDAHDFAADAIAAGAGALLVSKRLRVELPQLVVADTRIALGQLGA